MKANEVVLLWTPPAIGDPKYARTRGRVTVMERERLFVDPEAPIFAHSCGAHLGEFALGPATPDAKAALLAHFHRLTIRDGMNPVEVHEALLGIEEWQVLSLVSLGPEVAGPVG